MALLAGTFESQAAAAVALSELRKAGIPWEHISVLFRETPEREDDGWARLLREGVQTVVLSLVGLGTVVVGGPLMPILQDTQTVTDALTRHGLGEDPSRDHAERLGQGHILLTVEAEEERAAEILELLRRDGAGEVQRADRS